MSDYIVMYALSSEQKKSIMMNVGQYAQKLSDEICDVLEPLHLNGDICKPSFSKKPVSQACVDADTAFSKKTYHLKRQFLGKPRVPEVNDVRQNIFEDFRLNSDFLGKKGPFILVASPLNEYELSSSTAVCESASIYPSYQKAGDGSYYFRDEFSLGHEWQVLPSLFFDEQLLAYHVEPLVAVEIRRNDSLGMHYIRLPKDVAPQKLSVELLLSRAENSALTTHMLPGGVQALIYDCRDFKDTALTDIAEDATGRQYLDALIAQRKGACRHRAIVFKYKMERDYPDIPVRIVSNDCHMYAEVYYNNQWIKTDLGGYVANLKIDESQMPNDAYPSGGLSGAADIENEFEHVISTQGKPLLTGDKITTLTLKSGALFPDMVFPCLGTLILEQYALTAAALQEILQHTLNLKTLKLRNCQMSPEEFKKIDLSCLQQLEQVQLDGEVVDDYGVLQSLIERSSSKIEWHVKTEILVPREVLRSNPRLHITFPTLKPIAHRYFISSKKSLDAATQILALAQDTTNKSTLVNTESSENLRLAITQAAHGLSQSVYFVNSPEELRIAEAYLERHGVDGELVKAKGGPLYDFLTTQDDRSRLLLINFDAFKAYDIVHCNTILDEVPSIDHVSIPCRIIGLYNRSRPGSYTGSDFTSRFDSEITFAHTLPELPMPRVRSIDEFTEQMAMIEFSGEIGWEKVISGYWRLDRGQWHFEEGALIQAIREGKREFIFNNAPLESLDFQRFLHDVDLYRGVYHRGELLVELPSNVQISFSNRAPDYSQLFKAHQEQTLPVPCFLLNPSHTGPMFSTLSSSSDEMTFGAGLIEQYKGTVLSVYLTAALSPNLWLKLYQSCKQHNTTLNISCAPNVKIPDEVLVDSPPNIVFPEESHTRLMTEIPQMAGEENTEIVDISEVSATELIAHPKVTFDDESGCCHCSMVEQYLDKALASGKTVILKGKWTESVALSLHSLIFKRFHEEDVRGKLVLVSDNPALFSSLSMTACEAMLEEKRPVINEKAEYTERLQKVEYVLSNEPTVLLSGATGVGKTHFIDKVWKIAHPACHYGEEHLLDWLQDARPGLKTLFIDEANITDKQRSIFEDLYRTPPVLFYKGEYHTLTAEHKVIFAGNPLSYGGERELLAFFVKHQCQINFQPLPTEVFEETLGLDDDVIKPILKIVDYVTHLDPNDTLLTPREILMIAYLTRAFIHQNPTSVPSEVGQHFAYEICKQHIPNDNLKEFKGKFQPEKTMTYPSICLPNFVINPRNIEAIQALYSQLQLRTVRLKSNSALPLVGGLGGLILEGNPGIGKSVVVKELFVSLDLKEHDDFIHLPVKLSQKQKERRLLDAFHSGQIVMIDEINSSPMLERLLNALLEGHDLEGNPPAKPGFMLVGTQNPVTFSGRLQTTLPLKHRLQTISIEDYTEEDMLGILLHMEIPIRIGKGMIDEMKQNPSLCFRDIQKAARKWRDNPIHQKAIQIEMSPLILDRIFALQDEVLELNALPNKLSDLGFETDFIDVKDDFHLFLQTIASHLEEGRLPLIAFAIDEDSGLPIADPDESKFRVHAGVITGYNPSSDKMTLRYSGKLFAMNVADLFHSSNAVDGALLIVKQPSPQNESLVKQMAFKSAMSQHREELEQKHTIIDGKRSR